MKKFLTKSRICGLLCILLGVAAVLMTAAFTPKKLLSSDPGPKLFPFIGSIGLIIFGVIIFLQNKEDPNTGIDRKGWGEVVKCFALLAVYYAALQYIGFLASTPFMLFALSTMFTFGKPVALWKRIVYAVLLTAVLYVLFYKVLLVMLPTGSLWKLL